MTVWILVVFWVAVGLGVFLVALRGGRRQAPSGPGGGSPASRGATLTGIVAVWLVFGVALPAIVLAVNGDADKDAPGGVDLNSAQVDGRKLFAENCSTCHTLRAVHAVGRVGPNLDELRPPKELVVNAIDVGRAQGRGQMPPDLVTGQDARDVADFVAAVAGR